MSIRHSVAHLRAAAARSRRAHRVRRALRQLAALAAAFGLAASTGCAMMAKPPRELDYSRTRLGTLGRYRATFVPAPDPIPVRAMHAWTLHLETADGRPVDDVRVTVD